jgi:hypothetical protein
LGEEKGISVVVVVREGTADDFYFQTGLFEDFAHRAFFGQLIGFDVPAGWNPGSDPPVIDKQDVTLFYNYAAGREMLRYLMPRRFHAKTS